MTIIENKNSPATVASIYFIAFLQVLKKRGVDTNKLLSTSGIDKQALSDPDNQIPLESILKLLKQAAEQNNYNLIGLHTGNAMHPSHWGVLSYIMQCSPTLGSALEYVIRYEGIINSCIQTSLMLEGELIHLSVKFPGFDEAELIKPLIERDFSAILQCSEFLTGKVGKGVEYVYQVNFRHKPPAINSELIEYKKVFGENIVFSSGSNSISLYSKGLLLPVVSANNSLMPSLLKHVQSLKILHPSSTANIKDRVFETIKSQIQSGQTSRELVAKTMGIGVSNLQKQLQNANTCYRDIYEDVRQKIAKELLKDNAHSLVDIAFILGFSDASSFNTSFKKWTGQTPRNFQKEV